MSTIITTTPCALVIWEDGLVEGYVTRESAERARQNRRERDWAYPGERYYGAQIRDGLLVGIDVDCGVLGTRRAQVLCEYLKSEDFGDWSVTVRRAETLKPRLPITDRPSLAEIETRIEEHLEQAEEAAA